MPTEQRSISQMMKEGCADLHEKAEHATIPARMVSGQMSRDEYVAMLQQGVLWNRELDVAILESRPTSPYLTALVDDAQLQGPYYDADLKHFGSKAATEPSPGVVALCKDIEKADPLTLLGLHYVREGANNGNVNNAAPVSDTTNTIANNNTINNINNTNNINDNINDNTSSAATALSGAGSNSSG